MIAVVVVHLNELQHIPQKVQQRLRSLHRQNKNSINYWNFLFNVKYILIATIIK